MLIRKLSLMFTAAVFTAATTISWADHGSYSYSSGSFSPGGGTGKSISVSGAALSATGATLSFNCPITSYGAGTYQINWACAGGTVSITTPDKSVVFNGTFLSGAMSFSGGGGGKGGHVSYSYVFNGQFSGSVTAGGVSQGAKGSIYQYVNTKSQVSSAPVTGGSFGWTSAYSPLLVGDSANGRIVAVDGISGENLVGFGKPGTGTGEFESIAGITQDASGRIYVTDSALNRLARVDNIAGKNWVQIGSLGTGTNHFSAPIGVTVDAAGKIWVADSGNNRIVRMDDMSGTNWTSFGALGTGANQFSAPSAIAIDAMGRIYVADSGNGRLVRFDDVTGKNWVTLNEVLIDPYGYPFVAIDSVSVNPAGEIFVATGGMYGYLIGMADMTGANPSVSTWTGGITSMSLDATGTMYEAGGFTAGLAQVNDPNADGFFGSSIRNVVPTPGPVYAMASSSPPPAVGLLSATALSFGSQNVGEPGAAQIVTLTNLGSAALTIHSIATGTGFKVSKSCGSELGGGATCKLSVRFDPTVTGPRSTKLVISTSGVHPVLYVGLSGVGTAPVALVLPAALTFDAQQKLSTSGTQTVTLTNTGSGPLNIASIMATGDFTQTNNCGNAVQPGNGCTIAVAFKPTADGARTGAVTIADDTVPGGTTQTVNLAGKGTPAAPLLTLTPEGIQFPEEKAGTVSLSQTVTLKNNSVAGVALGAPEFPAGFKGATTCGKALAKGASCVLHVSFAPMVAGPVTGTISIPVTGQAALSVGLSGTGTPVSEPSALSVNPGSIDFGAVQVSENPTMTFTVTNTLGVPVAIHSAVLAGAKTFTLAKNSCGAVLAGNATCTIGVMFTPLSASAYLNNAMFTITEGGGAQTQVPITGEAVAGGGD